jgi:hypothetical protein
MMLICHHQLSLIQFRAVSQFSEAENWMQSDLSIVRFLKPARLTKNLPVDLQLSEIVKETANCDSPDVLATQPQCDGKHPAVEGDVR